MGDACAGDACFCGAAFTKFSAHIAQALAMLFVSCAIIAASILSFADSTKAASPFARSDRPPPGTKMHLRANSMDYIRDGKIAIATGNVVITYGRYVLTADRVRYNRITRKLSAKGNVRLKEPGGTVFKAPYLQLSDSFGDAFAQNLLVLMANQATITAKSATRKAGNTTTLTNATYTRCKACKKDPTRPLVWQIKADKIIHDKNDRSIKYQGASLEFLGVPVAALSHFAHADPTVKRRTGFLPLVFSTSDEFGFGVGIPFFWNLAPNYDVTFKPVITSRQGPLLQAKWRHELNNGTYSFTPAGIYQLTNDSATPSNTRFRGGFKTKGHFAINSNWQWGWDGTVTSDDTFFRRYEIDTRTDLISQTYIAGIHDRNYFSARAYHFRGLLSTDINSRSPYVLPLIDHNYYFNMPGLGGNAHIETSFMSLQRETGPKSTRLVTTAHWQRQFITNIGAAVTPFAALRGDFFFGENIPDASVPGGIRGQEKISRALPTGGLDVRMPFVSGGFHGVQQVFEPIAQLIVRPNETSVRKISNEDAVSFEFEETNLFAFNKFSGFDRWEGGTRINTGFNHTLLFNNGMSAKLTAGESFHLYGRNSFAPGTGLATNRSDFVAALQLKSNHLQFTGRMRIDERRANIRRTDISTAANFKYFNALLQYTDADSTPLLGETKHRREIFGTAEIQLSKRWSFLGNIRFNAQTNIRISNSAAVKYEDECFVFKLQYRENFTADRDIDPSRTLVFNFELKTIFSSGSSSLTTN